MGLRRRYAERWRGDSEAAGVIEVGVARELARGVGGRAQPGSNGGAGGERLVEVSRIDRFRRGSGEVGLHQRCRGRTPDRIERFPAIGHGGQSLCLARVGHRVVECGIGEVGVAICGEFGECGWIAAQQQVEVALAELRFPSQHQGAREAGFVCNVPRVAESLRGWARTDMRRPAGRSAACASRSWASELN